jgi:hypothetical protein
MRCLDKEIEEAEEDISLREFVEGLPRTLESLELIEFSFLVDWIDGLPPSLTRLGLEELAPIDSASDLAPLASVTPRLRDLYLRFGDEVPHAVFSLLPESLTRVELVPMNDCVSSEEFRTLRFPPHLTEFGDARWLPENPTDWAGRIPENLTELDLLAHNLKALTDSEIAQLPRSLRLLTLPTLDRTHVTLLPSRLTQLKIERDSSLLVDDIQSLPVSLTTLQLASKSNIAHLAACWYPLQHLKHLVLRVTMDHSVSGGQHKIHEPSSYFPLAAFFASLHPSIVQINVSRVYFQTSDEDRASWEQHCRHLKNIVSASISAHDEAPHTAGVPTGVIFGFSQHLTLRSLALTKCQQPINDEMMCSLPPLINTVSLLNCDSTLSEQFIRQYPRYIAYLNLPSTKGLSEAHFQEHLPKARIDFNIKFIPFSQRR